MTAVLNPYSANADPQDLALLQQILATAQGYAAQQDLAFTGALSPEEAWLLFKNQAAVLIDVRSLEERKFVGYVPDAIHVAWATGTALNRNPRFIKELENKVDKDTVVLFLCRSGARSEHAAIAAHAAGFKQVYNVLEGFEGDLNAQQQRNQQNGWRVRQLPWIQE